MGQNQIQYLSLKKFIKIYTHILYSATENEIALYAFSLDKVLVYQTNKNYQSPISYNILKEIQESREQYKNFKKRDYIYWARQMWLSNLPIKAKSLLDKIKTRFTAKKSVKKAMPTRYIKDYSLKTFLI